MMASTVKNGIDRLRNGNQPRREGKQNSSSVEDISKYNPADISHILASFKLFAQLASSAKYGGWKGRREICFHSICAVVLHSKHT